MDKNSVFTVVASVYNEQECVNAFYADLVSVFADMGILYEVVFVNDGSTDGSLDVLRQIVRHDANVKVIDFSRNFGHEAAMIAGIDHASGDYLICMDSDLQHSPEWMRSIKNKANKRNVSVDSMVVIDAIYMVSH